MRKHVVYIVLASIMGLLAGYLIFGSASTADHDHSEEMATQQMWTCSMHPQVMQPESGDCPLCGMDLIPAETDSGGLLSHQFTMTENAMALANIQTTVIGAGQKSERTLSLSGKIQENEEANAIQVSYFSGRIEQLHINFTGEKVRKGQLLATIYSPELIAAQQELITASALKTAQPELYNAVRNKLKLWKLSENQIRQIETSGNVKENFPLYATVSGTVTEKMTEEGSSVKQGQALYKIADLSNVWAVFDAYEHHIASLKKGQSLTVATKAYPDRTFEAKITFIDPVLNSATRTVKVRATLRNNEDIFKPGMFVQANIEGTETQERTITIPASAVLWTGKRSVVYVKPNPGQPVFEMREVTLGNYSGERYSVLYGLGTDEEIVTNGAFTVDAAAQLKGKRSMMNTPEDKATAGQERGTVTDRDIEVPEEFQRQLEIMTTLYMELKDVLVQSDPQKAQEAAQVLAEATLAETVKLLINIDARDYWIRLAREIQDASEAISETSDINRQRQYFKTLSEDFIEVVTVFGVNQKVYHQFCPMADDNKGAYWLSFEEKIMNPYFGDAMLHCGEVVEVQEY